MKVLRKGVGIKSDWKKSIWSAYIEDILDRNRKKMYAPSLSTVAGSPLLCIVVKWQMTASSCGTDCDCKLAVGQRAVWMAPKLSSFLVIACAFLEGVYRVGVLVVIIDYPFSVEKQWTLSSVTPIHSHCESHWLRKHRTL